MENAWGAETGLSFDAADRDAASFAFPGLPVLYGQERIAPADPAAQALPLLSDACRVIHTQLLFNQALVVLNPTDETPQSVLRVSVKIPVPISAA